MLTRADLRLIDALQLAPRASWATIAGVLETSPVTIARRWAGLTEQGIAWVTAAPGMARHIAQCVAYVEITCRPEHRLVVATAIAQHHQAVTVELTTGSADVLITVAAADLKTLSHYLLQHLAQVPNLVSSRARIATRLYGEGSAWRLHVLEETVVRELEQVRRQPMTEDVAAPPDALPTAVKTMLTQLALDGRSSFVELARLADISVTTARRHVSRLLHAGVIILRTDVNAFAVNWPVQVYLWADAPVDKLDQTARALSRFPQARLTATVAAGPRLALCSWLRTVEELHRLELAIAAKLPQVTVMDRLIVLRQIKRMGRLLDENGNAIGVVPINLWDDLLPHTQVQTVSA